MYKIKITAIMCIILWTLFLALEAVSIKTDRGSIRQAFSADADIEPRDYKVDIIAYDDGGEEDETSCLHYILSSEHEENKIIKELKSRHKKYDIYRTLTGHVKGKISEKEQNIYIKKIYRNLGAVIDREYRKKDTFVYGYSENLGRTVNSRGKKINCQVIISYNEIENVTEITVGSPVVFST